MGLIRNTIGNAKQKIGVKAWASFLDFLRIAISISYQPNLWQQTLCPGSTSRMTGFSTLQMSMQSRQRI